jgi:solute carrier family 10 (sodium/bile acid cotransporter), member 7
VLFRSLGQGFLILACVPTTITSCVALTKAGGGNEAGAVCNATLGNLLGVFLSPALVYALAGRYGGVEFLPVIRKLSLMVVLPIGVGQLLRLRMEAWAVANRKRLGAASQVLLLAIIYIVFIKTFSLDLALPMRSLAATVALALGAHVLLLCLAWPATALRRLGFSRGDRIAALFCSTQKTVALGIPLITILYEGDPRAGLLAVPLLCYHPLQLIADSVAASMLAGRGRESR